MGSFFQRKPVRYFLTAFKWCRIAVLLALLLAVAALACLQWVGLPDFLKKPLLRTLRQRGFEAQFVSARLGLGPSIVIENATFSPTNQAAGPRLSAGLTVLNLNAAALLRARLQVDSFQVLHAGLRLPAAATNQEPVSLTDVNLHVLLPSTNLARLDNSSAWFRGIRIHLNAEIRDFLAMRDWKLSLPFAGGGPARPPPSAPRLTAWDVFQKIHFTGTPGLNLHFYADGRDTNSPRAEMEFTAEGAQTPWGQFGPLHLRATCARLFDAGGTPFFQVRFLTRDVVTPWGASRDLSASVDLTREARTNFSAFVHLAGHQFSTAWKASAFAGGNWVRMADFRWEGTTILPSPSFLPDAFEGTLKATQTDSGWGSVGAASLVLQTRRAGVPSPDDPAWGPWNQIKPFTVDWQAEATNILTPKLKLERVAVGGGWHPPQLTVNKLEAIMYRGHLQAGGALDAASRQVQARLAVDFDPHQISPLLSGPAQHWISLYDWEEPPKLRASLRCELPPWSNRAGVWPEASRDSLQLAGDFSVGRGAFRGLAVHSAQSSFSYTNRTWNVSGLRVEGPGGRLGLDYTWNEGTHAYHFRFDSKLDPGVALPLLTEPEKRALRQMSFLDKPEIQGQAWGDWRAPQTTGFAVTLAASRMIVRGETVDRLSASLDYTNRFLRIRDMKLVRGAGSAEAPLAGIDFASHVISMTNALSTLDPEPVRRALGGLAPPFLGQVHFDPPPLVHVAGSFIPGDDFGTDLRFEVQGRHFRWDGLEPDSVHGEVHYHVRTVEVTNVEAVIFQTGKLQGSVNFEWQPGRGTRFTSEFSAQDIQLGALFNDLTTRGNKLEGTLDGRLALAAPFGASVTNLYGHGGLHVYNGLLWDIKLFGLVSPMLNAIVPGSGDSRAREASAGFIITNGVIATDNLEIKSSGFRLLYRGTVDPARRINARVEAHLLRDTPVFGHYLSWMLTPLDKLFEYRVTGTLQKPVAEPLYIPKLLMGLLRPFHSLKKLLPSPPVDKPGSAPPPAPTPAKQPK